MFPASNGRHFAIIALAFMSSALLVHSATNPIEFIGIAVEPKTTSALLRDNATSYSRWIDVGETFEGYLVKSYDPKAKTLILSKASEVLRLNLNGGSVAPADAPEIAITGITAAPKDHPDRLCANVIIKNYTTKPLYYRAYGRDGLAVNTEVMKNGSWDTLAYIIVQGMGIETYQLAPGESIQCTVRPFAGYVGNEAQGTKSRDPVIAPVRFRVDLSSSEKLEGDVIARSRVCSIGEQWLDAP